MRSFIFYLIAIVMLIGWLSMPTKQTDAAKITLSAKAALGKKLFFETRLSDPVGQSCASCHDPNTGFADPDHSFPTSKGAITWVFGPRNAPTAAYSSFIPQLSYNETLTSYVGGLFWDGRVDSLSEQAERPFLNSLEMHNYNKWQVLGNMVRAGLAPQFKKIYGANSLKLNSEAAADAAFANMADAIAEYERSRELNRFDSKFDRYLQGRVKLTRQEARGLALFNGKAFCFACHTSTVAGSEPAPLFTNFTYHNLGVPKNWYSPFLYLPEYFNPFGMEFEDLGLGNTVDEFYPEGAMWEDGKFRTPTLRNVAKTAPYGHNGVFKTLKDIVHFYNTRDVPEAGWDPPEIYSNLNVRIGNLGLTSEEEDDIVAFLKTLSDY